MKQASNIQKRLASGVKIPRGAIGRGGISGQAIMPVQKKPYDAVKATGIGATINENGTMTMPDKGERLGSCNRQACQAPGAYWYNRTMRKWYCTSCARLLNQNPLPGGEVLCVLDPASEEEYHEAHA